MFELTLDDQSTVTLIPVTTYEPTCIDGSLSHEWLAADRETSSNNSIPVRSYDCSHCDITMDVEAADTFMGRSFYKGDIAIDLDIDPEDVYIA